MSQAPVIKHNLTHVFEKGTVPEEDVDVFILDPDREKKQEPSRSLLIRRAEPKWEKDSTLDQVCSSLFYVHVDDPIEQIVEELSILDNIFALGVIDSHGEALGVIVRRELFDLMGRSYGKNFMAKKRARSVMKHVKSFSVSSQVFSVAASLEEELKAPLIHYFLIKDRYRRFAGVFSTKDMMLFYSRTLNREMKLARTIQESIVEPEVSFRTGKDYIHGISRPSREAGGDYYCLRELGGNRLFYCVADVSGKGFPASLITAVMGSLLENTTFSTGLEGSLGKLNTYLKTKFGEMGIFVTGLFVLCDRETGRALVCDCGHQYYYLLRDRSLKHITGEANPPLGIMEEIDFKVKTVSMRRGDTFFMLTDGLTEQTNEQGEEYPLARLVKALIKDPETPSCRDVLEDIGLFRGFSHQHDDMTMLVHRRL